MDDTITKKESKLKQFNFMKFMKRAILVFVIALIIFILMTQFGGELFHSTRLDTTRMRLNAVRAGIKEFRQKTGRYPDSLGEMKKYGERNPETGLFEKWGEEFLSDLEGNSQESTTLNDRGGWYYNKETGEVKINLTKPLKYYLKGYFGPRRNDIPAEW